MMLLKTAACGSLIVGLTAIGLRASGQDPAPVVTKAPAKASDPSVTSLAGIRQPLSLAERFALIMAEWKAANQKASTESDKGKTEEQQRQIYWKHYPNEQAYFGRSLALARENPRDIGARDAWLWVVTEGMRNNDAVEPRASQVRQAVEGLLAYHATDIRVIRTALNLDNISSANRTALARGLYEKASTHEAKGVASVVLALVLEKEAGSVEWAQSLKEQPTTSYVMYDEAGKPKTVKGTRKHLDDAYFEALKRGDAPALRREIDQLYDRVIAEYADVPLNPMHYVDGQRVPNPHPRSLADHARAKLDDLHQLVEGNPAPEVEGVDLNGKPLRLSDFKGKVVALVFWNSGCGPCLAAVPHERALLERLQDQPFAILGVNAEEKNEAALNAVKDHNIPWSSWRDGAEGPIVDRFHVRSFPTVFVIDAQGIIRSKNAFGNSLDKIVTDLLKEREPKPAESK